jgi:pimeloyl-ACP methyl ester carboxylesterase
MNSFKLIGSGQKKFLFFPGLLGTQDAFDDALQYADLAHSQYAVMNYRGYGSMINMPGRRNLGEIVTDAYRLIEYLGWNEVILVGHSVGALAAQMTAIALPERTKAIISLAGLSLAGGGHDATRLQRIRDAAGSLDKRIAMVAGGTGGQYTDAFARKVAQATWDQISPDAFASYGTDGINTSIAAPEDKFDTPILVVVGERDPGNTVAAAKETTLNWYKHATLEVLTAVGHFPMIEAPATVMSLIDTFQ